MKWSKNGHRKAKCLLMLYVSKQCLSFPNSSCMEIQGKRRVFSGKLKGNGNFQNFQHKEHGEISELFAVASKLAYMQTGLVHRNGIESN